MTPAARLQTAIELLDDILDGAPAEKALTSWARRSRYAGSKDRAAVRDHVFDALRRRNSAASLGGAMTGRGLMIGLCRQDGVDMDQLFSGQPYGPAELSDAERRLIAGDVPDGLEELDLPDWLLPSWRAGLGTDSGTSLAAQRQRAPVSLRVNLKKTTRAKARTILEQEGIVAHDAHLAKTGLIVTEGARRIAQSHAYRDGFVELQDISGQAAIESLPLRNGMRVLDYCAGGGGKTLAMAGQISGKFFAHDAYVQRMRDLPDRASRAGVKVSILSDPTCEGPYDLVFCDVPCSGSGTWRRAPDAKWRISPQDLTRLQKIQADILLKASALVAPQGRLIYATCSVLVDENRHQISEFIRLNPDWRLVSYRQMPIQETSDGFFFAILTR